MMSSTTDEHVSDERTPLLPTDNPTENGKPRKTTRWPSIVALTILCIAVVLALAAGFALPAVVEEYAKQAVVFEPGDVSIEQLTADGVRARIQGMLYLDASKVKSKPIRDLGRMSTWIARRVESGEAHVHVYMPGYNNSLVGSATIPPVNVGIRNGHVNQLDIVVELVPEDVNGIQAIVRDFLDKKLKGVDARAEVQVPVSSGIFNLGTQSITHRLHLQMKQEKVPDVRIEKLAVDESHGLVANAVISTTNPYPVTLDVPPVMVDVLLPGCFGDHVKVAAAGTDVIHVLAKQKIVANVSAKMMKLPTSITQPCPNTTESPLDRLVSNYMRGDVVQVFATGGEQDSQTPEWIGKLLRDMLIPLPVPVGHFNTLIKNLSMSDVQLKLPEDPKHDSNPTISATVIVTVDLGKDIHPSLELHRVRAKADVFYEGEKLGELDLRKWQQAEAVWRKDDLLVRSEAIDAPLRITNETIFSEIVRRMISGGGGFSLTTKAQVDVDSTTGLGRFVVRNIPGEGTIFIESLGKKLEYDVKDIEVIDSDPQLLTLKASAAVFNPTKYSAYIPSMNVSLWCNGTNLGYAWGSFNISAGNNTITAFSTYGKSEVGRQLLSQYLSGQNVSITVKTHEGSVPGLPTAHLDVDFLLPHVFGKFLRDTTMHILSSTATFVLFTPIQLYITTIAASAFYNKSEIGNISYDYPFKVITGGTETPRLPVDWNNNGGFGLIKEALGGTLKLDARANVGVKIGDWEESVWYEAKGVGAKIRF